MSKTSFHDYVQLILFAQKRVHIKIREYNLICNVGDADMLFITELPESLRNGKYLVKSHIGIG